MLKSVAGVFGVAGLLAISASSLAAPNGVTVLSVSRVSATSLNIIYANSNANARNVTGTKDQIDACEKYALLAMTNPGFDVSLNGQTIGVGLRLAGGEGNQPVTLSATQGCWATTGLTAAQPL
jgi:hypothetical protein